MGFRIDSVISTAVSVATDFDCRNFHGDLPYLWMDTIWVSFSRVKLTVWWVCWPLLLLQRSFSPLHFVHQSQSAMEAGGCECFRSGCQHLLPSVHSGQSVSGKLWEIALASHALCRWRPHGHFENFVYLFHWINLWSVRNIRQSDYPPILPLS